MHLAKADTFYSNIREKVALTSKTNSKVEVLTFHYQQNLPLPVSSSGEVFYKIQLWVYNFCIHVPRQHWESYFHVYDEALGGKMERVKFY